MGTVTIHNKQFKELLDEGQLKEMSARVGNEMSVKLKGKNPVFLVMLNGAYVFAADVLRNYEGACQVTFVCMKSYDGMGSTGKARELIGLEEGMIEGRDVVIVEDIIDTGFTMRDMIERLQSHRPKSVQIATLLLKPHKLKVKDLPIEYVGKEIEDAFVVGYGLDYNEQGRTLRALYQAI